MIYLHLGTNTWEQIPTVPCFITFLVYLQVDGKKEKRKNWFKVNSDFPTKIYKKLFISTKFEREKNTSIFWHIVRHKTEPGWIHLPKFRTSVLQIFLKMQRQLLKDLTNVMNTLKKANNYMESIKIHLHFQKYI